MNIDSNLEKYAPSVQDRIIALSDHWRLFEEIGKLPQTGMCERFGEEWSAVIMHLEAEVHQARRDYETFMRENYSPGRGVDERKLVKKLRKVMNRWNRCLSRHGTYPNICILYISSLIRRSQSCGEYASDGFIRISFEGRHGPLPRLE